jgi:hypothetical protein
VAGVPVTGLLLALCASMGVFYLYTGLVLGWRGTGLGPAPARATGDRRRRAGVRDWLVQAGLGEVDHRQFAVVTCGLGLAGSVLGLALFGGLLAGLALGCAWRRCRRPRTGSGAPSGERRRRSRGPA